jgi:type VI secretion system protein ImpB
MPGSLQHKLDRVRPPRVQITYDVEIGGAIVKKELPLVVGVLADLSGNPAEPLPKLRDRKFVEIDRDNFNDVLAACSPRLALRVSNTLDKRTDSQLNVELRFKELDDFTPYNVLQQVAPLKALFEARQKLSDLLGKLDGNDALEALLQQTAASTDSLSQLQAATANKTAPADASVEEEPA